VAWHQLCAAGERPTAVSARMPRDIVFTESKPFRKAIFAVLMGNLSAVTIEPPGRKKDQLAAFRSSET